MPNFLTFYQNNTGGSYFFTEDIGGIVVFQVPDETTRDNYAEYQPLCLLFDSIKMDPLDIYETDCECCGGRWDRWNLGNKIPNDDGNTYTVIYSRKDDKWVKTQLNRPGADDFLSEEELVKEYKRMYNRRAFADYRSINPYYPNDGDEGIVFHSYCKVD